MDYFINQKHCFHELLVWCKTNPIPTANGTYLPDIEYCLMFREKGTKIAGTYNTKSKWYLSSINKQDKDKFLHPTIKPVELIERHLINSALYQKTKDYTPLILDPFAGSGSTCLAAKHLELDYIGFEIDEGYHKIAEDRLNGINQKGEMNLFDI